MEILDENETNYLLLTDDGTEIRTKSSKLNQLLFGAGLYDLLRTGDEIWENEGRENQDRVTIIPDSEASNYTIKIEDAPDLTLSSNRKTDLVSALHEAFDGNKIVDNAPILRLYEEVRDNMVRPFVLEPFLELFGSVEAEDDGWFINNHLLLTYEGEFYHSENVSRSRSGAVIGEGTSVKAYEVDVSPVDINQPRNLTIDGENYRLTNGEMEFLARVIWAVKNTKER